MIFKFADCESMVEVEKLYAEEKDRLERELKALNKLRNIFITFYNK